MSMRLTSVIVAGLLSFGPLAITQAATYTAQEAANMKLVADFYAALDEGDAHGDLKQRIRAIAGKYLRPDYIQHMAAAQKYPQGREGLIQMFEQRPSAPASPVTAALPPATIMTLVATGDLVIRVSSRIVPGPQGKAGGPTYIFNMFRIQDGKLAEHWDGSTAQGMSMPGKPPAG
jgi:predicted SnoaL-like aldol condensation-catalyzing enzyme